MPIHDPEDGASPSTQPEKTQGTRGLKKSPSHLGWRVFFGISGIVIILDQITKLAVLKTIPLHHAISVIPGFFNLTHIHNPGGAFGFMADGSEMIRTLLFIGVTLFAMAVMIYFYRSTPKRYPWLASALAMVFGGAAGNFIDRVHLGEVVDFLDVYIGPYHWPAFNIADSAITIGLAIFIIHVLLKKIPEL
ncbi:signal peptidase II [Desulfosarcina sp. OttesenSCG-928-A07]|nr:signal peptidase II [Desulfosarcina sp. OttesenSCG-928-G17]MDL2329282.1 signal peptidase II [Desulfosarcina sp. OttesenSCG-928-A07]